MIPSATTAPGLENSSNAAKPARRSRRQELLNAALECFDELGYAATTIEVIRDRADASIGSLYHHFDGKQSLANVLYLDLLTSYQSGFLQALRGASTAEDGIVTVVKHHLGWAENRPDAARFLLEQSHLERILSGADELPATNRQFYAGVETWFRDRIGEGTIRPLSADLFYALWLGPAQEFSRQFLSGRSRSRPTIVSGVLADAAWQSLKSPSIESP